jgi:hypothetical protein
MQQYSIRYNLYDLYHLLEYTDSYKPEMDVIDDTSDLIFSALSLTQDRCEEWIH